MKITYDFKGGGGGSRGRGKRVFRLPICFYHLFTSTVSYAISWKYTLFYIVRKILDLPSLQLHAAPKQAIVINCCTIAIQYV